jgi:hypothetical protein
MLTLVLKPHLPIGATPVHGACQSPPTAFIDGRHSSRTQEAIMYGLEGVLCQASISLMEDKYVTVGATDSLDSVSYLP